MSEGRAEQEVITWIGVAVGIVQTLHWSAEVNAQPMFLPSPMVVKFR